MKLKKITQPALRFAARVALNICSLVIKIMPGRLIYGFARRLAAFGYLVAAKQRKIALQSLQLAFGGSKSPQEIEQIARDCFTLMAKSGVELMYLMDRPELLKKRVEISGKEHLEAALKSGRGAILVSAHFGNFPLLLARLSQEGYTTGGIMRPMRDAQVEKIFLEKRKKFNVKTIYSQPRNVCVEMTLKALRANELVFIPIDQNFGTAGVFVNFFGRKAATATGPVVLAQRTKAALLPCFIVRQPDDTHKIFFEPAIDLVEGKDSRETISVNIQKLTEIIEQYIRRYPAEWGWIHRRWKSQPGSS
jgi:Kdo2-lipid IVA lauroyltransferase/acyltransferase